MRTGIFRRKRNGKEIGNYILGFRGKEYSLKTLNFRCAEKRAEEIKSNIEKEEYGVIPAKSYREALAIPLERHLEDYTKDMSARNLKPAHIYRVEITLKKLFSECGWQSIKDIQPDDFNKWRERNTQLAAKTRNEYLTNARSFFKYMVNFKRLRNNPLTEIRKVEQRGHEKRKRRAFTPEELQRFFDSCPEDRKLVYILAAYSGLRRGELSKLQWRDIDFANFQITVRPESSKNKRSATLPIAQDIAALLKTARPVSHHPTDHVFDHIPEVATLRKDLERVGIPYKDESGQQLDFHAFRKTFDTLLHLGGSSSVIVQKLMRHEDIRLTTQNYLDSEQLPLKDAVNRLPLLFQKRTLKRTLFPHISAQSTASPCTTTPENQSLKTIENIGENNIFASECTSLHEEENGCPSRARTYNMRINSALLYH